MRLLTDHELRDLLRILTIERARMEADKPSLLTRSTGAHRDLCERIREIKAELNSETPARQEAA